MSAPSAKRKKLPFMAADPRLEPLATKSTNEALSVVAGQQEKKEQRAVTLFSSMHDSASSSLHLDFFFKVHKTLGNWTSFITKTTVTCSRNYYCTYAVNLVNLTSSETVQNLSNRHFL